MGWAWTGLSRLNVGQMEPLPFIHASSVCTHAPTPLLCAHPHPIPAPMRASVNPIFAALCASLHLSLEPIVTPVRAAMHLCTPSCMHTTSPRSPFPPTYPPAHPLCARLALSCPDVPRKGRGSALSLQGCLPLVPATERRNCVISYKRNTRVSHSFFFFF